MRLALALVLLSVLACDRGEDDDAPRNVPAGIRPEDATFRYRSRNGTHQLLEIRLSTISFCSKTVPDRHPAVSIDVLVPNGQTIGPGTYPVSPADPADAGGAGRTGEVSLIETSAGCTSSSGLGSRFGSVTLTEVTPTSVRGTFEGTNPDTRLALRGSFVAVPCPDQNTICGL